MRTITIQADKPLDAIMEQWLAHLVLAIPVGPDGIKFDGSLSNGTIVNQRTEGQWTVSFRPNPDGSQRRAYSNPYVVARVIITREHETVANLPARDVTAAALRAPGGCATTRNPSDWPAIMAVAKSRASARWETLCKWVRQAGVDAGRRPGATSEESAEIADQNG